MDETTTYLGETITDAEATICLSELTLFVVLAAFVGPLLIGPVVVVPILVILVASAYYGFRGTLVVYPVVVHVLAIVAIQLSTGLLVLGDHLFLESVAIYTVAGTICTLVPYVAGVAYRRSFA